MKSAEEGHKSNSPSQIQKSEKLVEAVMSLIKEEYMNPFYKSLEKIAFTILALEFNLTQK